MNIKKILNENFEKYIINNSSNRTMDEILKITQICQKCENIIAYIERNTKNEEYFKYIELYENLKGTKDINKIKIIILNKENYVYFRNLKYDEKTTTRMIKKSLIDENECVICYEDNEISKITCEQCCLYFCNNCLQKMGNCKIVCPICKNDCSHMVKTIAI
jgi:hypothetical protein